MFEAGKHYLIVTNDGGGETQSVWLVDQVDMPLIKLTSNCQKDQILNTSSSSFVRAEQMDYDPNVQTEWDDLLAQKAT